MTERSKVIQQVRTALRQMGGGIGRLNGAVGSVVNLKGTDVEILDHIGRTGPVSPGDLATSMNIHPATMTGILDRLENGGWLIRERSVDDRRRVQLRAVRTRGPELVRLYAPMNSSVEQICADLTVEQLETVRDFLASVGEAATRALEDLRQSDGES
jgi:DNA-binding MarR family transcriptional regulator